MILELPPHRFERIADRDIHIRVCVMFIRLAARDELAVRNGHINADVVLIALLVMPVPAFDHDATAGDAIVEFLQIFSVFANPGLDRLRAREISERDLQRYLHGFRVSLLSQRQGAWERDNHCQEYTASVPAP
jgi:hypothetical protein